VYVDGRFYPRSQARISVFDHGLLYGDGIFEGIRAYGGSVFRLQDHLERLVASARYIRLTLPLSIAQLTEAILETLRINHLRDAYIRLVVTRGEGDLGVDPRLCPRASVIIITEPIAPDYNQELRRQGVTAVFSTYRRDSPDGTSHEVKSLNYLNSVLAKIEATDAAAYEAIMLDHRGFLSEATITNVFIVKHQTVATPPPSAGILHGVTRARVMELVRELGYRMQERDITPFELLGADEAFLTGTKSEVLPLIRVSGRIIRDGRPGPVTQQVIRAFERIRQLPTEGIAIAAAGPGPIKRGRQARALRSEQGARTVPGAVAREMA
jgi:branched-chain amino acid aminotransferase